MTADAQPATHSTIEASLIYHRIPHHAAHSGYDQLATHLARRIPVRHSSGLLPQCIPAATWDSIVDRAGMRWYDHWSLGLECAAALEIARRRHTVHHVLYGENSYHHLSILGPLARFKNSRIISTFHQPPAIFDEVITHKDYLKKLDGAIAVSSTQAAYLASLIGREKVFSIPHGVDTAFFHPGASSSRSGKLFLFVGQWLRDFSMLKMVIEVDRFDDPEITFRVVAREKDVSGLSSLDNVDVRSAISETELLLAYQSSSALVLPLTDCTANNTILEAMACGLPIIATDVGGVGDYVDERCAITVPAGDVAGMRDAVLKVSREERLRSEMGRQSRRRGMRFDWGIVVEQLVQAYSIVMARSYSAGESVALSIRWQA